MRKHSSMVFQGYNLFKNKTALENVMEALTVVQKKSKAEAEKIALELLDKVGMSERKDFTHRNCPEDNSRELELQEHLQ